MGEDKVKRWNEQAEEMATHAKDAAKLSVEDRVKQIETNFATIWKLNHDVTMQNRALFSDITDASSWPEDVRNSWNWRRRFAQLADSKTATCIRYLSEKANLETVDMCTLPKNANKTHIHALPVLTFSSLGNQGTAERREYAADHQLAVGNEILRKVLDVYPIWPKHLYPILFTWQDSDNNDHCAVFAP